MEYGKTSSLMFFPQGGVKESNQKRLRSGAAVIAGKLNMDILPFLVIRNGLSFTIVRGDIIKADNMRIEDIMEVIWDLKEQVS